jgi:hypothetical protein
MKHDPWRYDFSVRYLRHDIPERTRLRLETLGFVRDGKDLLAKRGRAAKWFERELASLDVDAIPLEHRDAANVGRKRRARRTRKVS